MNNNESLNKTALLITAITGQAKCVLNHGGLHENARCGATAEFFVDYSEWGQSFPACNTAANEARGKTNTVVVSFDAIRWELLSAAEVMGVRP
jgi:hypothetical protein